MLISCVFCWNHLDMLTVAEYNFSRFGQFAYQQEHNDELQKRMRVM